MDRLEPTKVNYKEVDEIVNKILDLFNENHSLQFYKKVMYHLDRRIKDRLYFKKQKDITDLEYQQLISFARQLGFYVSDKTIHS